MTKRAVLSLALISLTTACVTSNSQSNVLLDASNVSLGQTAYADGPKIRPVKILEDSRCPINARCVRAGDVRLLVEWVRPNGNQTIEVWLGKPAPMADGQLTLTDVRPGREAGSGKELKPANYRFSFKFDGGL